MSIKAVFTYIITEMKNQWNNITIDEFAQIRAVLTDKGSNQEEKMIRLAAIVKGVSEDTILNLPLAQAQEVFAQVWELNEMPHRNKVCKTYEIGGWKLHLTTKEKMSVAQWVDFQNYYREDFEGHLPEILSVALVPEGKKYNEGYDIGALIQTLRAFPVCDALAVCFFFQKKYLKSMQRTLTYLVGWSSLKGKKGRQIRQAALQTRRQVSDILHSL